MPIGQIQSEGGVNPLKDQHVQTTSLSGKSIKEKAEGLKIEGDKVELSQEAKKYQLVEKFKKELETIPSPNEGRINELKQSIANGTFLSDKVVSDTAQVIADKLMS